MSAGLYKRIYIRQSSQIVPVLRLREVFLHFRMMNSSLSDGRNGIYNNTFFTQQNIELAQRYVPSRRSCESFANRENDPVQHEITLMSSKERSWKEFSVGRG